jgi:type IV pilus assembly protein PilW
MLIHTHTLPRPFSSRCTPGASTAKKQRGLSLLELMVGITIGLMTIAVALGALMVSRGISGAVNDASQLQQQAAHALRTIGLQVRQAGSLKLNLAVGQPSTTTPTAQDTVAFEADFDKKALTITGQDNPSASNYSLSVGYPNYQESLFGASGSTTAVQGSLLRDCLRQESSTSLIQSRFRVVTNTGAPSGTLVCAGATGSAQPLISGVSDFQIRYLIQQGATSGTPTMQYVSATAAATAGWDNVYAIEVCLELTGDEVINTQGDASAAPTYRNCAGQTAAMGPRIRMVFRNNFLIRSQGGANL